MELISISNGNHLGDSMVVMNLLHSRVLETNEQITIRGPAHIEFLLKIFDYKLSYGGVTAPGERFTIGVISLIPTTKTGLLKDNKATVSFLTNRTILPDQPIDYWPKKVVLPEPKCGPIVKENMLCFQFDSRSAGREKPKMEREEAEEIISCFQGKVENIVGIGGVNTRPYLHQYEFRLGNLWHLLRNMLSCQRFVGSDSGMSHLAGTAKTSGDIVMMHPQDLYADELIEFYKMMYPTLRCYRRHGYSQRIKVL